MRSRMAGVRACACLGLAVSSAQATEQAPQAADQAPQASAQPPQATPPATAQPPQANDQPPQPTAQPPQANDQPAGVASPPPDAKETPSSLEVFVTVGPSVTTGEPANASSTTSFRRVGVYGELGVAYRSSYFLDPFLSVGYGTLASADTALPDGVYGTGGTLHQHLGVWLIAPGITSDLWRFRLRLGIGVAILTQGYSFRGDSNTATQKAFAFQAGLGFNVLDAPRFRLDADVKFAQAKGADLAFWVFGVTARADLIGGR
jgi:hypothetical protein